MLYFHSNLFSNNDLAKNMTYLILQSKNLEVCVKKFTFLQIRLFKNRISEYFFKYI